MAEAYIIDAVRTPVGRRRGGLATVHPADLGAHVLRALVDRTGIDPGAVEDVIRAKYERLFKQRGQNVVVGIQHGVCGGCHMTLSRSIVVTCQAEQEIITCPNCSRILYYTRDMDLAAAE